MNVYACKLGVSPKEQKKVGLIFGVFFFGNDALFFLLVLNVFLLSQSLSVLRRELPLSFSVENCAV